MANFTIYTKRGDILCRFNLGGKVSIVTGMGVLGEGKTGIGSAIALNEFLF